jgi:hypothetical protein
MIMIVLIPATNVFDSCFNVIEAGIELGMFSEFWRFLNPLGFFTPVFRIDTFSAILLQLVAMIADADHDSSLDSCFWALEVAGWGHNLASGQYAHTCHWLCCFWSIRPYIS